MANAHTPPKKQGGTSKLNRFARRLIPTAEMFRLRGIKPALKEIESKLRGLASDTVMYGEGVSPLACSLQDLRRIETLLRDIESVCSINEARTFQKLLTLVFKIKGELKDSAFYESLGRPAPPNVIRVPTEPFPPDDIHGFIKCAAKKVLSDHGDSLLSFGAELEAHEALQLKKDKAKQWNRRLSAIEQVASLKKLEEIGQTPDGKLPPLNRLAKALLQTSNAMPKKPFKSKEKLADFLLGEMENSPLLDVLEHPDVEEAIRGLFGDPDFPDEYEKITNELDYFIQYMNDMFMGIQGGTHLDLETCHERYRQLLRRCEWLGRHVEKLQDSLTENTRAEAILINRQEESEARRRAAVQAASANGTLPLPCTSPVSLPQFVVPFTELEGAGAGAAKKRRNTKKCPEIAKRIGAKEWGEIEIKVGALGIKARLAGSADPKNDNWLPEQNWYKWNTLDIRECSKYWKILIDVAQGSGQAPKGKTNNTVFNNRLHDLNDKMCWAFGLEGQAFVGTKILVSSQMAAISWVGAGTVS